MRTNTVTAKFKKRAIAAVVILVLLGFGADIFKLFYLQVLNGEKYKSKAEEQQLNDVSVSAGRGVICDCNMKVLAQSASAWLVYVDPSKIADDDTAELISSSLADILKLKKATIAKKISNRKIGYVEIAGKIDYETKEKLRKLIDKEGLYGVVCIDPDTKRYYPYSNFASTVIGFTGSGDTGRAGVELQYNDSLLGTPGRIITAKNARDGAMKSNFETVYDAKQGVSHVLTIDENIQHYLEKGLTQAVKDNKATSAYGIVMEVKTGAVLAMATMPDYDLNNPTVITNKSVLKKLSEITDEDEYDVAYNEKTYSMWRNKAISDTYEPGSVFKIITAASALEEGVVTKDFTYTCTGAIQVADNTIHCHYLAGHGTQTLAEGLKNSCNPFYITVGQKLGEEKFSDYFEAFGFTEKTGIDLPGEAEPTPDITYHTRENMGLPQLSSSAFGQTFQVSAIQMITAVCAVANGGKLMKPYVLKSMIDSDGKTVYEANPQVKRQVISKTTSDTVIDMMEKVVSEGTGKNAYIPGYRVCGKTGTSEKLTSKGKYIASFVGCAPANDPEIAVLIVIDEPGNDMGGGAIAAPVAGSIIEQSLKYMNVEPMYTDEELAQLSAVCPGVTGKTVSAARNDLNNKGFTARVVGDGEKVISQYPVADQTVSAGGVVILYTEEDCSSSESEVPDLRGLSISGANEIAVNSGFNIKISGTSLDSEVVSYRQSIEPGTKTELGSTITVYFSTTSGVQDR